MTLKGQSQDVFKVSLRKFSAFQNFDSITRVTSVIHRYLPNSYMPGRYLNLVPVWQVTKQDVKARGHLVKRSNIVANGENEKLQISRKWLVVERNVVKFGTCGGGKTYVGY